jgi:hypothetical protein
MRPNRLQNLFVSNAELTPRQLRRDRTVQELRALPLRVSDGKVPFFCEPQELLRFGLACRVVDEGGEARLILVEAVDVGKVRCGVRHPQGVIVAFLREPRTGEGCGVLRCSVRVRVVLHATDCRIRP